jgi:hypothetical protein
LGAAAAEMILPDGRENSRQASGNRLSHRRKYELSQYFGIDWQVEPAAEILASNCRRQRIGCGIREATAFLRITHIKPV